eukprot:6402713-Alexandrium_andersonii.AAC.1
MRAVASLPSDRSGRRHGGPLAAPEPTAMAWPCSPLPRYLQQRLSRKASSERSVREACRSLDALASTGPGARRAPERRQSGCPAVAQEGRK